MKSRYTTLAGYNTWANARIYEATAKLSDADYRADRGAFFKSMHGTLNHMVVADRIWMFRFTGAGDAPTQLNAILYEDFGSLREARRAEDERIARFIDGSSDADLAGVIRYRTITNPATVEQELAPALDHFFNHQTHHRGQAHCLLGQLGIDMNAFSLDLILYQRQQMRHATGRQGPK